MSNAYPTSLPPQILNFIESHDEFPDEQRFLADLCSNPKVSDSLAKLCRSGDSEYRQRVISFLEFVPKISTPVIRKTDVYGQSRSVARKELKRISTQAIKFANTLKSNSNLVGKSIDLQYLIKRKEHASIGSPYVLKRMGLRSAPVASTHDAITLVSLLHLFANDICEELTCFQKRLDNLDGSKDAPIKKIIELLITFDRSLSLSASPELLAEIATRLARRDGFLTDSDKDIDPERVKKRKQKGKNTKK